MKKNKMMRLASALLVLTLLTTCVISGTFAKYVTEKTATDTVRVAKWGVDITLTTSMDDSQILDTSTGADETDVMQVTGTGSESEALIAPGTKGQLAALTITGTPEVSTDVSLVPTFNLTGWEIAGDDYCPIIFTAVLNGVEYTYEMSLDDDDDATDKAKKFTEITALVLAINTDIQALSDKYYVSDTAVDVATSFTLSWEWKIEGTGAYQTNVKDTALGNLGKVDINNLPKMTFGLTATVTQID